MGQECTSGPPNLCRSRALGGCGLCRSCGESFPGGGRGGRSNTRDDSLAWVCRSARGVSVQRSRPQDLVEGSKGKEFNSSSGRSILRQTTEPGMWPRRGDQRNRVACSLDSGLCFGWGGEGGYRSLAHGTSYTSHMHHSSTEAASCVRTRFMVSPLGFGER